MRIRPSIEPSWYSRSMMRNLLLIQMIGSTSRLPSFLTTARLLPSRWVGSDQNVHIFYSIFSGHKLIEQGSVDKSNEPDKP